MRQTWHDRQVKADAAVHHALDSMVKRIMALDLRHGHNLGIEDGDQLRRMLTELKTMRDKYATRALNEQA